MQWEFINKGCNIEVLQNSSRKDEVLYKGEHTKKESNRLNNRNPHQLNKEQAGNQKQKHWTSLRTQKPDGTAGLRSQLSAHWVEFCLAVRGSSMEPLRCLPPMLGYKRPNKTKKTHAQKVAVKKYLGGHFIQSDFIRTPNKSCSRQTPVLFGSLDNFFRLCLISTRNLKQNI